MIWFTSDTHFFHKKMMELRGFRSVEQMNFHLIWQWNRKVKPFEIIYHLGDLSFGKTGETADIVKRLNGEKILVRGNHDTKTVSAYRKMGFADVADGAGINIQGHVFRMAHLPYREGQIPRHMEKYGELYTEREEGDDTRLLCGHVHQNWKKFGNNMLNVGVDVWDMAPVSADQVLEEFGLTSNL